MNPITLLALMGAGITGWALRSAVARNEMHQFRLKMNVARKVDVVDTHMRITGFLRDVERSKAAHPATSPIAHRLHEHAAN